MGGCKGFDFESRVLLSVRIYRLLVITMSIAFCRLLVMASGEV